MQGFTRQLIIEWNAKRIEGAQKLLKANPSERELKELQRSINRWKSNIIHLGG